MEVGGEQKLMNAALMRKYQKCPGRLFVKIYDTSSGGKQVNYNLLHNLRNTLFKIIFIDPRNDHR